MVLLMMDLTHFQVVFCSIQPPRVLTSVCISYLKPENVSTSWVTVLNEYRMYTDGSMRWNKPQQMTWMSSFYSYATCCLDPLNPHRNPQFGWALNCTSPAWNRLVRQTGPRRVTRLGNSCIRNRSQRWETLRSAILTSDTWHIHKSVRKVHFLGDGGYRQNGCAPHVICCGPVGQNIDFRPVPELFDWDIHVDSKVPACTNSSTERGLWVKDNPAVNHRSRWYWDIML